MPPESNGKMLSAIMNQQFILHLIEDNRTEFDDNEYRKVYQFVLSAEVWPESEVQKRLIFRDSRRSTYNGFGVLSVKKVSEMVKYFICKEGSIFPTKLNKEMFYADFLHYKLHGQSISGLQYHAIQYGSAPVHYDTIYNNIDGVNKDIVVSYIMESTRLSCEARNLCIFTEEELQTLQVVAAKIQPMSTQEVIEKSHEEDAWKNHHKGNQIIPYTEGFTLKLITSVAM